MLEVRSVDGCLFDVDFFLVFGVSDELELGRVNGRFVDSDLFVICRLESRTVFTLGHVNLSLVVMTTVVRKLDRDISVNVSSVVWDFDVDVCGGMFVVWSGEKRSQLAERKVGVLVCRRVNRRKKQS